MKIDLTALATYLDDSTKVGKDVAATDFPKSEPVLQSSYVFPKVESHGIRYSQPSIPFPVPAHR